ncbi:MAG: S-ribosylhomocysteine lyase [Acholeplasmatales bacterium]|nr:S-ribosylhomocysteine lyase [Acholeplasmatales bacterium]
MEKITSFTVDHMKLLPGIHVSRVDTMDGFTFTTFDLRITRPNFEPVMNTAEIHTIEHLGATFFRNYYKEDTMYFGPMGCRTGFYLIVKGKHDEKSYRKPIVECFKFIKAYEGEIPGASPIECGNYLDQNLNMAKFLADKFLKCLGE